MNLGRPPITDNLHRLTTTLAEYERAGISSKIISDVNQFIQHLPGDLPSPGLSANDSGLACTHICVAWRSDECCVLLEFIGDNQYFGVIKQQSTTRIFPTKITSIPQQIITTIRTNF